MKSELNKLREKRIKLDREAKEKQEIRREKEKIAKHSKLNKTLSIVGKLFDKL